MSDWRSMSEEEREKAREEYNAAIPDHRAKHEAWMKELVRLRGEASAVERKASGFWVAGIGSTNADAWRAAKEASAKVVAQLEKGLAEDLGSYMPPGPLPNLDRSDHLRGLRQDVASARKRLEEFDSKWIPSAEEGDRKLAAKKVADEAASKKAATSAKRKATIAAKKAGVKDWAKT